MVPILAAATRFLSTQTQALEHGPFLFEWVIVAVASAKTIAKVLVVLVVYIRLLRRDIATRIRLVVRLKCAWTRSREALRPTVACKVSLLEDFDESVFAVALDRT